MPRNVQKAIIAYLIAHAAHWFFNELIDEESRKHGWTPQQIEWAKLAVGGFMLVAG
jgi:hypothetical protein